MPRGISVEGHNDLTLNREHVEREVKDQNAAVSGGGVPSSVVSNKAAAQITPYRSPGELAPSLDDREKAQGLRYMNEDGDTFRAQMRQVREGNPGLSDYDVARSVLRHRGQQESNTSEQEIVMRLHHGTPEERRRIMARAAAGLPLIEGK